MKVTNFFLMTLADTQLGYIKKKNFRTLLLCYLSLVSTCRYVMSTLCVTWCLHLAAVFWLADFFVNSYNFK